MAESQLYQGREIGLAFMSPDKTRAQVREEIDNYTDKDRS